MIEALRTCGQVLGEALHLWSDALGLHPYLQASSHGWWPFVVIAFVATLSTSIGQSVVLYFNRLRGRALVFALAWSLATLLLTAIVYGGLVALGAPLLGPSAPTWAQMVRVVLLAASPLALSFVTVMPLLGTALERLLQLWVLLVLWAGATLALPARPWQVGLLLVVAALALMGLQTLVARPLQRLRDRTYRRLTGEPLHASTAELLELSSWAAPYAVEVTTGVRTTPDATPAITATADVAHADAPATVDAPRPDRR